jgi:IS5 family transposase
MDSNFCEMPQSIDCAMDIKVVARWEASRLVHSMNNNNKRDWSAYNQKLKRQASLDLYISADILQPYALPRARGGVILYNDALIEGCLFLRMYFSLGLRQTEGMMAWLVRHFNAAGQIPNYTTICRRAKTLNVSLKAKVAGHKEGMVIAVDSTGLSLLSSDSWNRDKHCKKRGNDSWHKLHMAIDTETGEILACQDTPANVNDCEMLPALLNDLPTDVPIEAVCADMAYDTLKCREAVQKKGATQRIPPKATAVHSTKLAKRPSAQDRAILKERDDAISFFTHNTINACDKMARKRWKQCTGYHRRSLVETSMARLKAHTGSTLKSLTPATKTTECRIKCKLLNLLNQA